jgi:hypothetical protein
MFDGCAGHYHHSDGLATKLWVFGKCFDVTMSDNVDFFRIL